jgi:uncharacterized protein (TIGR02452 family)
VNSLSNEVRVGYQKIAKETQDILRKSYYKLNGRKVDLSLSTGIYEYESVEVYSPNSLSNILKDTDEFMKKQFYAPEEHEIILCQMEGYEAAKDYFHPLILNCSNPFYPGGGYMAGLDDSEERFCRASSLYQSLSSQKASQMYLHHDYYKSKLNSDFIILSPHVAVFRNSYMELIEHPYPVSALSVTCVDCRKPLNNSTLESEIDAVMKERIRKLLMVAARNMYRNLILGDFGWAVYGHSSYRVARYFFEVLIEEEYIELFEKIIFAISNEAQKEVFDNFTTVFGPVAKIKYQSQQKNKRLAQIQQKALNEVPKKEVVSFLTDNKIVGKNYIQAVYPFPECNYNPISQNDIQMLGFSQGILKDGVPFGAELLQKKHQKEAVAVFVLPYLKQMHVDNQERVGKKKVLNSVLCYGMEVSDENIGEKTLMSYLQYLYYMNLINLKKSNIEAFIQVLYDRAGHKVVAIEITLRNPENVEVLIPLQFQPFAQKLLEDKKLHKTHDSIVHTNRKET